jgi:hypothetical protein
MFISCWNYILLHEEFKITREICETCNFYRMLVVEHKFLPVDSQCELRNIQTLLRL